MLLWGFTMSQDEMSVDEDLPNMFTALMLSEAEKIIAENRQMQDEKTEKKVALAKGTESAMAATSAPPKMDQEGSELAIPNIDDSPYLDLYNSTSQF